MTERFERLEVSCTSYLKDGLKVPIGTVFAGKTILKRFYEPGNPEVGVPRNQINPRSKPGEYRLPEHCYGTYVTSEESEDDKFQILGRNEKLDHVLNLMAGYDISRALGKDLVKLLVAQIAADQYRKDAEEGDQEAAEVIQAIDTAVDRLWSGAMR